MSRGHRRHWDTGICQPGHTVAPIAETGSLWRGGDIVGHRRGDAGAVPCVRLRQPRQLLPVLPVPASISRVTAVPRSMTPSPPSSAGCSPSSAALTVASLSPMGVPITLRCPLCQRRSPQDDPAAVSPTVTASPVGMLGTRAGLTGLSLPSRATQGVPSTPAPAGVSRASPLPRGSAPVPARAPLTARAPSPRPRRQRPEPPPVAE